MKQTEILLTIKLHQELFIDPKRVRLLKEIKECGSINQAAKNAKVSYKSAWDHLEAMNKISPKPLLERNIGGKNGGGTSLTLMPSVYCSFMICSNKHKSMPFIFCKMRRSR